MEKKLKSEKSKKGKSDNTQFFNQMMLMMMSNPNAMKNPNMLMMMQMMMGNGGMGTQAQESSSSEDEDLMMDFAHAYDLQKGNGPTRGKPSKEGGKKGSQQGSKGSKKPGKKPEKVQEDPYVIVQERVPLQLPEGMMQIEEREFKEQMK